MTIYDRKLRFAPIDPPSPDYKILPEKPTHSSRENYKIFQAKPMSFSGKAGRNRNQAFIRRSASILENTVIHADYSLNGHTIPWKYHCINVLDKVWVLSLVVEALAPSDK